MWVLVVVLLAAPKQESFETRVVVVEQLVQQSRQIEREHGDPTATAAEAIARARALVASAPKNGRAALLLGFALEQGAAYGLKGDPRRTTCSR